MCRLTYQLRVRLGACGGLGLSCSAHTAEDELFKWRTRTHWLCMFAEAHNRLANGGGKRLVNGSGQSRTRQLLVSHVDERAAL